MDNQVFHESLEENCHKSSTSTMKSKVIGKTECSVNLQYRPLHFCIRSCSYSGILFCVPDHRITESVELERTSLTPSPEQHAVPESIGLMLLNL